MPSKSVTISAAGDNTLLDKTVDGFGGGALTATQRFRVFAVELTTVAGVAIRFTDGPAGTRLRGWNIPGTGGQVIVQASEQQALFECSANTNLVANLDGAVPVDVNILYGVAGQ